jgi:putative transposase
LVIRALKGRLGYYTRPEGRSLRSFGYDSRVPAIILGAVPFRLYAHLTWTTFGRLPLIDTAVADFLARFLLAETKRHNARVVEIGIVRDHVHLLLELPPAYDVPRLVQGLKGASARLANRDGHSAHKSLRWEPGYDCRSVGLRQLPNVAAYVRDQELKHGSPRPSGRAS